MSIFGDGARVSGGAETSTRGEQQGLAKVSRGELELTAMAGACGVVTHSHETAQCSRFSNLQISQTVVN